MRIHWLQSRDGTAISGDTDDGYEVDLNLCPGNDVQIDIYHQGRKVSSTREQGTLGQARRRAENTIDRHRRRSMRSMKTTRVTPAHRRLVAACVPNLSRETIGRVALVVARWCRGLYHKGELSKQFRYAGVDSPRERQALITRIVNRPLRSMKAVDKRTAAATLRRLGYTRVRFLPGRSTTAYPIFSAVGPEGARVYLRVSTRGTVREYDSASNAMNDVLGRQVKSISPMKIGVTFDEYCYRANIRGPKVKREFLSYMERIPVHGRLLQKVGRQPMETWVHYWNKWSRGPGRRVLQGLA